MKVATAELNSIAGKSNGRVSPSILPEPSPFTLDQTLETFGRWVSEPVWVPPKDASKELACSMLEDHGLLSSKEECWKSIVQKHAPSSRKYVKSNLPKHPFDCQRVDYS